MRVTKKSHNFRWGYAGQELPTRISNSILWPVQEMHITLHVNDA